MILEENEIGVSSSRTLAARESMLAFFQQWIENDKLTEAWNKHKINAGNELAQFLQEYSTLLAEAKGARKQNWLEQSINRLEELEKLQLKQRFMLARTCWDHEGKRQLIHIAYDYHKLPLNEIDVGMAQESAEAMIFMPEAGKQPHLKPDMMDILRKGFTNARAFLNILNLSEAFIPEGIHGRLELQLQVFKNQLYAAYQSQTNGASTLRKHKALKDAFAAYEALLNGLGDILVHIKIYNKASDACKGILYMAEFLWSKNYERPSIHIQHSSSHHANMLIFEPRFIKGSGNKEASWVKKLAKKHHWIKNLPWQVLQRPLLLANRDREGLKIEKVTLVSIKKIGLAESTNQTSPTPSKEAGTYLVDCIPIGELGGIPVPFAIDDLTERYKIALMNQKSIYLGSQTHDDKPPFAKLEEVIFTQVDVLTPIITQERRKQGITLPLVDINLTQQVFPYKEDSISWLQDRADANKEIRQILARYAIYYDDVHVKYVYLDKTLANFSLLQQKMSAEHYIPIHVEFCDPTIIDDGLGLFPCKTNEDVHGLKVGLKIAVERLEMLKERLYELVVEHKAYQQDINHLTTVQKFLQSRSVGWYRPQKIPAAITEAVRQLSEKLRRTACPLKNNPSSNRKIQVEMLKILQSSLVVKSESFETLLGFILRVIDNRYVGPLFVAPGNKCFKSMLIAEPGLPKIVWGLSCLLASPFFITGWMLRLTILFGSLIVGIPSALFHRMQKLLGVEQRYKPGRLAAAIGILFSAMGKKKLNCKSAVDQALSVLLNSGVMISRAIHGDQVDGKTPLMTDKGEHISENRLASRVMKYQQLLKATGLQITRRYTLKSSG